jgi:hypothetical protein
LAPKKVFFQQFAELQNKLVAREVDGAFLPNYYAWELLIKYPGRFHILPLPRPTVLLAQYPDTVLVAKEESLKNDPILFARISNALLKFLNAIFQDKNLWVRTAQLVDPTLNVTILSGIWDISRKDFSLRGLILPSDFNVFVNIYSVTLKKKMTYQEAFDTTPLLSAHLHQTINITLDHAVPLVEYIRFIVKEEISSLRRDIDENVDKRLKDAYERLRSVENKLDDLRIQLSNIQTNINWVNQIVTAILSAVVASVVNVFFSEGKKT